MKLKATLVFVLVAAYFLLPITLLAQQSICEVNRDFRPNCREVNQLDKCSRQFTEVCCSCQEEWDEQFEYCSFQPELFPRDIDPTPTPIATASPTPTPTDSPDPTPTSPPEETSPDPVTFLPEIDPDAITCAISISHTDGICTGEVVRIEIDTTGTTSTRPGSYNYSYRYDCEENAEAYQPAFVNAQGSSLTLPESSGVVYFQTQEPGVGEELSCFLEVQVELENQAEPARKICRSGLLVNECRFGCESTYILDKQLMLDGAADVQRRYVLAAVRLLKKTGLSKKKRKKIRAQAQDIYNNSWSVIWSIPPITKQCESEALCATTTNEAIISNFQANSAELFLLARKTARQARKKTNSQSLKRRTRSLIRKAKRASIATQAEVVASIPESLSLCTNEGGLS